MNVMNNMFETSYQSVPFSKISEDDFMPALETEINKCKSEIEKIIAQDEISFDNTIIALEDATMNVELIESIFSNLYSAESNDKLQVIAKDFFLKSQDFSNYISFHLGLFKRIENLYESQEKHKYTKEQSVVLENSYRAFIRNGANLSDSLKERLKEIDKKLAKTTLQFADNLLEETNQYWLEVNKSSDLDGLPQGAIDAAKEAAVEKKLPESWLFTFDVPSYLPFMKYLKNRDLRKKFAQAYSKRCCNGGETDNKELVKTISYLRHERANLLGYNSHADFVLERRMASNVENVMDLLNQMLDRALPVANKQVAEIIEYAKKNDGIEDFQVYDFPYYSQKVKMEKYDFDDEVLRPYFKLENVIDGVFTVASKLYDLEFIKTDNVDVYHEDVSAYEVRKNGSYQGLFYTDFFPRPGKRGGAWETSFKRQYKRGDTVFRPHSSIVCNFTKPTNSRPSLLTFNEVTTLFHEFGHALHDLLSDVTYRDVSGTNVFWDFVELPSQVMENWVYEKECLDLFANHYETGDKMPEEHVQKIKMSSNFNEGYQVVRQVSLSLIDMSWHTQHSKNIVDVIEHEKSATKKTQLLPPLDGACVSTSFSHVFSGGYSAGYYSYKWAEVLDADAFEKFKEEGIFNKEVANSFYENILSKGGSDNPMTLYKNFRGKDPSVDAVLKRGGLI